MPTLSFIHEGSFDKVLANTTTIDPPYTGPLKPVFVCPFCNSAFDTNESRRQHISSAHPATTPRLVVGDQEMLSQRTLYTEVKASEVFVFDCTHAEISVDNSPFEPLAVSSIPKTLARMRQARANLRLFNKFAANAQPVASNFDLRFRVITAKDIEKADRKFVEHLGIPNPKILDVDRFSKAVGDGPVRDYSECFADYVLVVLERDHNHGVDTVGRRSFTTLSRLKGFHSPLANLISSLMRFISNDFTEVDASKASTLLHGAYSMFSRMEAGVSNCWERTIQPIEADGKAQLFCPIDSGTDAVLRRFDQLGELARWTSLVEDSLRADVANPHLPSLDRAKIYALWAANALRLGVPRSAIEPLQAIEVNNCFGRWASLWIKRLDA